MMNDLQPAAPYLPDGEHAELRVVDGLRRAVLRLRKGFMTYLI